MPLTTLVVFLLFLFVIFAAGFALIGFLTNNTIWVEVKILVDESNQRVRRMMSLIRLSSQAANYLFKKACILRTEIFIRWQIEK